jgi:hypothetical protein
MSANGSRSGAARKELAERVESIPFRRLLFHKDVFEALSIHTNRKPTPGPSPRFTVSLDNTAYQVAPVWGVPDAFLAAVSNEN